MDQNMIGTMVKTDRLVWVKTCHSKPGTPHFDMVLESQIEKFKSTGYVIAVVHRPERPAYVVHPRKEIEEAVSLVKFFRRCVRAIRRVFGATW